GHLNLGAGRIVRTDKCRIDDAIGSEEFFENRVLVDAMQNAVRRGSSVHFAGLLSDAGIHSSAEHLFALLRLAKRLDLPEVYVHCFLDGRDVPVKTADIYVEALEVKMDEIGIGRIATLCGRHFAMDSEGSWDRTARAYTMMVHAEGEGVPEPKKAIRDAFVRGYSDEFVRPIIVENETGGPVGPVRDGDVVIFFNHRGDSLRQLADSLAASGDAGAFAFSKPRIEIVFMTEYDDLLNALVAFPSQPIQNSLVEVLAENDRPSFRITETERVAHLGDFFGQSVHNEMSNSDIVHSVDSTQRASKPEMSSFKLADRLIGRLDSDNNGFYVINLPAPALMAESGDLEKTVEAVQFVDTCLGGILDKIREKNGVAIVTASHAGCEEMRQRSSGGQTYRASPNPVPFHLFDSDGKFRNLRSGGAIEDVAPTILGILGLGKPSEMTGNDLRV
ncbi:MAG: 2,3-bisphosphoglycerate-independent phosphoglycerate mutase, partial [Pyrinomonadaceae bacterium]